MNIHRSSTQPHIFLMMTLVVIVSLLCFSTSVIAQNDSTAPDERIPRHVERVLASASGPHLWFVRARGRSVVAGFRVAHHLDAMGPGASIDALLLPDRPELIIAVDDSLYCIFEPQRLGKSIATRQVVRASVVKDSFNRWQYASVNRTGTISTPLPGFGKILGTADDGTHPLVLLSLPKHTGKITKVPATDANQETTKGQATTPEGSQQDDKTKQEIISENDAPKNTNHAPNDLTAESDWWSIDTTSVQSEGVLLRLGVVRWESIPLPSGVIIDKNSCRLLPGLKPILLVQDESGDSARAFVLQPDFTWSEPFTTIVRVRDIETAVSVLGQTIFATAAANDDSVVEIHNLRRGKPVQICSIPDRSSARALVGLGNTIGLMDYNAKAEVNELIRIDLENGKIIDQTPMNQSVRMGSEDFSTLILVGALLLTVVIVFLVRPDPTAIHITLPQHASLAEPRRRLMAALIDLIPSAILAIVIMGVPFAQVFNWPLISHDIADSQCALLLILITVIHSTISELIWGSTLGKVIFSCRVLNTHGKRAGIQAILIRNLLKSVVLVVPPLALFVFLNPYRQRLGDLVAKTIVVVDRHEETDDGKTQD